MINILASSSTPPQADNQRSALALLHQNLMIIGDYSPEAELWDWDLKTDCCSWMGVVCNGDGLVTELVLFSPISATLKLKSPILEMVFQNLSFLVRVSLDDVGLSAQSSSWCEAISHLLPNLRVLSLSHCALSGPICSSLFTLPSLELPECVPNLDMVESVDDEKIANHLDRVVGNLGRKPLKVLVQVNTSVEECDLSSWLLIMVRVLAFDCNGVSYVHLQKEMICLDNILDWFVSQIIRDGFKDNNMKVDFVQYALLWWKSTISRRIYIVLRLDNGMNLFC
ncbi:unnamed protein product [Dovyalis caffra]|uniref:Leucine-rich repeat-containing N-terminal plant-type domain-containing protein n=1 Tax=Dovyalis caffra TaxID=77055 RepID=A0AAV1SJ02_9ROSI|nr:unnamed protein product [Dovyalis caffra]